MESANEDRVGDERREFSVNSDGRGLFGTYKEILVAGA
jgi:hypothetical protein